MSYEYSPFQEYSKRDKSKTVLLITVGVLVFLFTIILFYHLNLISKYQRLEEDYLKLYYESSNLKLERDNLLIRIGRLEDEVSSLKESYNALLFKHQVSERLRINNLLANYYDEVRSLIDIPKRGKGSNYLEKAKFMAELARHSLGRMQWPVLEARFYEISGEHSYTMAMRKMDEVFELIDIKSTDTHIEKIEKILRFITSNIRYEKDYDELFLAPLETLAFKSGDCDDYAILVASLFEKAGISSAVGIFTNGTVDHAMVLIRLDSLSPYGFHYYQDLTGIGLSPGRWILIEPQATIDRQYDPKWFNQWRLQAAVEV
ncbi:MAG: hypothetical protein QXF13_06020 [Thermoproteota archaeon]